MQYNLFATCPKNLESLLEAELGSLGATATKPTVAGVKFSGDLAVAYRACLWSRFANRILLPLINFTARDARALYAGVRRVNWLEHITPKTTFVVNFNGTSNFINNTHFGALKVKDAIVDQIRSKSGVRPNIDKLHPDVWINVYLRDDTVTVYFDLSGESLHRRKYRDDAGKAPLKENLASAILQRAGWVTKVHEILLDPMCGSGTLLIEAALMAKNVAPGLFRQVFGFTKWLQHDDNLWQKIVKEAQEKPNKQKQVVAKIYGYDANPRIIAMAKNNAALAGVDDVITFAVRGIKDCPNFSGVKNGLIVTNPPYGVRLGNEERLKVLYRDFGDVLKKCFPGWLAAVFAGNPELCKEMHLRSHKEYQFFNGAIPCKLLLFSVHEKV